MGFSETAFGFGPSSMFTIMDTIFPLFFLAVIGIIIFSVVKGISQWSSNNKQPVLSVAAKVVSKRTNVSSHTHHHGTDQHHHHSSSTTYYCTFEVESGDRLEFSVKGQEFGQLAEGDFGKLTFQGTRYLGFERKVRQETQAKD